MPDTPGRRVLLDENVNQRLLSLFDADLLVTTVSAQGWKGLSNGELLREAADSFDVFVSMDGSLPFQQNIKAIHLGIVVVRAQSNAMIDVAPLMSEVNRAVRSVEPGEVVVVGR